MKNTQKHLEIIRNITQAWKDLSVCCATVSNFLR